MGCSHSVEAHVATMPPSLSKTDTETKTYCSEEHVSPQANELKPCERPILKKSTSAVEQVKEIRKEEGDLKTNVVHLEVPFGKPIEEVYDGVHDGPILGSGISGEVRLVTHKATGIKYAVKCLDLGQIKSGTEDGMKQLREEIVSMCQLDHPNIVRLEEVYESHSEIYLVQELCVGGDLFDRLDAQPDFHYTEAQCARLVKEMLSSLRYLHSKGIIHRDLKLENFLFSSADPDSELKMIDFGLSKHFNLGDVHHEAVGTPYTVAPEVIQGSYDEKCDVWGIGVLSYLLLSGNSPFGGCGESGQNLARVKNKILQGNVCFKPDDVWSGVSSDARDFIRLLLRKDPQNRPTAEDAQQHPWIQGSCRESSGEELMLRPEVAKALVSFKEYSDIHKLLCEVLSFTLLPEQIKGLRKEFEKMDKDGSGEISLSALKTMLMENASSGSLGALTEEEIEDVFNAMRVRKTEQCIQWHEFIAASITQCRVDERNLRLAFDRVDHDHKGFITFDNFIELVGTDGSHTEDALRVMWGDSMKSVNCHHACIAYDDFLLFMKGQTPILPRSPQRKRLSLSLAVPENESLSMPPLPFPSLSFETYPGDSCSSPPLSVRPVESSIFQEIESSKVGADSRRVFLPPEYGRRGSGFDITKSPLVVNRTLYRAHRQMRLAVLDACKRFEEQQAIRARETLRAQSESGCSNTNKGVTGAALVMRHHRDSKDVSAKDVQRFLTLSQKKQESLIETATRRGGRRGRIRKKTISDMSCMMTSLELDSRELSVVEENGSFLSMSSSMNFASQGKSPSLRTFGKIEDAFGTLDIAIRQE